MEAYCGIDWAEDHHDVALVDVHGRLLARLRIGDDAAGLAALLALLAEHGEDSDDLIAVAIETPRGLLTACLRATGRAVYPINPMAVARYRDRHSVAGRKSDHGDAVVLANILRTDTHSHRPLPVDSELAQAIAVLARAQQDAVWARTTAHNKLRSHLREYYPGFLAALPRRGEGSTGPRRARSWRPLRTRPRPRSSPRASCRRCCAGLVVLAASPARRPGCVRPSAGRRCASFPWSSRPWAVKRWRCSASSTPAA